MKQCRNLSSTRQAEQSCCKRCKLMELELAKSQERLGLPADTADSLMKKLPLQGTEIRSKKSDIRGTYHFLKTQKKGYVGEYPHKIWPYMVQYLHFWGSWNSHILNSRSKIHIILKLQQPVSHHSTAHFPGFSPLLSHNYGHHGPFSSRTWPIQVVILLDFT